VTRRCHAPGRHAPASPLKSLIPMRLCLKFGTGRGVCRRECHAPGSARRWRVWPRFSKGFRGRRWDTARRARDCHAPPSFFLAWPVVVLKALSWDTVTRQGRQARCVRRSCGGHGRDDRDGRGGGSARRLLRLWPSWERGRRRGHEPRDGRRVSIGTSPARSSLRRAAGAPPGAGAAAAGLPGRARAAGTDRSGGPARSGAIPGDRRLQTSARPPPAGHRHRGRHGVGADGSRRPDPEPLVATSGGGDGVGAGLAARHAAEGLGSGRIGDGSPFRPQPELGLAAPGPRRTTAVDRPGAGPPGRGRRARGHEASASHGARQPSGVRDPLRRDRPPRVEYAGGGPAVAGLAGRLSRATRAPSRRPPAVAADPP
jgi:hypothetical protein